MLSPRQAAQLAAELANLQCKSAYKCTPFEADSYEPALVRARWHWGKMNAFGPNGYAARVEFDRDGSDPVVEVALYADLPKERVLKFQDVRSERSRVITSPLEIRVDDILKLEE